MSEIPSFQRIDYSTRTNKNVERKIVFETLAKMRSVLPLKDYRYLGFGSLWFVDYVLAHRFVGIVDMISIERTERAARAEFNKPYDCIEIRPGTSTDVLSAFSDNDWAIPTIAWMDYDGRFDADSRGDCEKFLRSAAVGSVLVVTVNANRSSYRGRDPTTSPPSIQTLRELMGDSVPVDAVTGNRQDVGAEEFPQILSKSMLNFMVSSVRTCGRGTDGYPDRFVPLFEMSHADGATMVTVGGVIVSWKQANEIVAAQKIEASELFAGTHRVEETLDLIPITLKEKLMLDRMLPCESQEFQKRLTESALKLDESIAEKYRRLYRYFPIFAETAI